MKIKTSGIADFTLYFAEKTFCFFGQYYIIS